jgi:hypothetical protein
LGEEKNVDQGKREIVQLLRTFLDRPGQIFAGLITTVILIILSTGCDANAGGKVRLTELDLAPLEEMPDYVQAAPREVQEAYRFAAKNPALLKQIPCFCGCNAMDHMNNLDCYVDDLGQITEFDNHAAY